MTETAATTPRGFWVTSSAIAGAATLLAIAAIIAVGLVVRYGAGLISGEDIASAACVDGLGGDLRVDDVLDEDEIADSAAVNGLFELELGSPTDEQYTVLGTTRASGERQSVQCVVTLGEDGPVIAGYLLEE